jgi:hypothetical protein
VFAVHAENHGASGVACGAAGCFDAGEVDGFWHGKRFSVVGSRIGGDTITPEARKVKERGGKSVFLACFFGFAVDKTEKSAIF